MDEVAFWFAYVLCVYDGKFPISQHGMGSIFGKSCSEMWLIEWMESTCSNVFLL
jgi:hypothetical protein